MMMLGRPGIRVVVWPAAPMTVVEAAPTMEPDSSPRR